MKVGNKDLEAGEGGEKEKLITKGTNHVMCVLQDDVKRKR